MVVAVDAPVGVSLWMRMHRSDKSQITNRRVVHDKTCWNLKANVETELRRMDIDWDPSQEKPAVAWRSRPRS